MSASDKWVPPPEWEGLTNKQALSIYEAFVKKWVSFLVKEVEDDHAKINSLPIWDQLVLRAKWEKKIELELAAFDAFRRYKTPAGEVELIAGQFGDQLGLPAQSFPADVSDRLEWYKRRIAADYERSLKSEVNKHGVKSPIEQIFLMERRFLRVDEQYGVKIRPQDELKLGDHTFTIDFMVEVPGGKIKLAIELDGHEFHEKTKEQAARDRKRERTIISHGYTIFRFTGSEVFRNPCKCVEEVISMIAETPR